MNHLKFLEIISFVYVLVTVKNVTGSSVSHDEECSALFQFKQTMIHQHDVSCVAYGSQVLHSWNTSFDCCSWEGVACNNDHDQYYVHVIGIDLSERSLCGHINSNNTLFNLVHLQRLNLSGNDFGDSQIPSEIGRLKQLRSLDLSYSGFSGQIPNEISQLIQLSSLDLSGNSLKLYSPSLKNLVQNLTRLEELHLSGVDISSSVPRFLANFSSLRSIKLRSCSLQNEFPSAILDLPKLQLLDLAYNTHLTGFFPEFHGNSLLEMVILGATGFFGIVPESISHLKQLKILSLSECSFSGRIPGSLSNLSQLTFLGLGDNKFTGSVPSLGGLLKLDVLELGGNKFEKGCFPNWLGKLTKLSKLSLSNMNINGEIPLFLANLTKLNVLDMEENSLIGRIPSWLYNLTQLTILDLQINQLQGPIPNTFSSFKSLEYLDLGKNNFSGRVELDMFLGLNQLQTLSLSANMISLVVTNNYTNTTLPELDKLGLSSCNLKEFPAFLRFQNKLRALLLDDNKIDGLEKSHRQYVA
ncbi:receptor-like protein 7 [Lactuca sativa]|uniref:receptor-like protein 7 n=1 Tax=Lactuca sativa TaxID=4236 RepID=UPI0022B02FDC|nr:receptor-like protein 7 [Lactuca sativa]